MPTTQVVCGLEEGIPNVHIEMGTGTSVSSTTKRTGGYALRVLHTAAEAGAAHLAAGITPAANVHAWRVYIRFVTLPDRDCALTGPNAGGTTYENGIGFKVSDSTLRTCWLNSGTPTFGSSGIAVTTGVWYRLDVKVDASADPHVIDGKVDGVALAQLTHAGTAGTTNEGPQLGNLNTAILEAFYDDLVYSQDLADFPFGPGHVDAFFPTADGTHNIAGANDFERTLTGTDILNTTTDAFELVNDLPLPTTAVDWINMVAPPGAGDYVRCTIGPAPGFSAPAADPNGVSAVVSIHQAATTVGNMECRLVDGASKDAVYSATGVAGVTSIVHKLKHYATKPSGGAWTATAFNALEVEFGSPTALDVNPDQYFDAFLLEADIPSAEVTQAAVMPITVRIANPNVGPMGQRHFFRQRHVSWTVTAAQVLQISLDGTMSSSGALVKTTTKILDGAMSSAGALVKTTTKLLAGTMSSSGVLVKTTTQLLAGTLTSSGALIKTTIKVLAGTLTSSGALSVTKVKIVNLAGTLTSSGALVKTTTKILDGAMSSAGALVKTTTKLLAGTMSSSGALVKTTIKVLAGTLTSSGALSVTKVKIVNLAGTLTSSGTLVKTTTKILDGSLSLSGALVKSMTKVLAGSLTSSGALQRSITKVLGGTVTSSGALIKTTTKLLGGVLSSAGALLATLLPGAGVIIPGIGRLVAVHANASAVVGVPADRGQLQLSGVGTARMSAALIG